MPPINICHDFRYGKIMYNQLDQYVGKSLKLYGEYSQGEADIFEQLLQPGDTVIEAGANIGSHTVHLAQIVGPNGKVYAFEPQRLVFQLLAGNIAINSLTNVYCRNQAVGECAGELSVPDLDPLKINNWGGLSLLDKHAGEKVPVITLDSLHIPDCRLLKADVEGMELFVLKGAIETINRCRPYLYLEADRSDKQKPLFDFIFEQNYKIYHHNPPLYNPNNYFHNPENVFIKKIEKDGNTSIAEIWSFNVLCVPKELNVNITGFEEVVR